MLFFIVYILIQLRAWKDMVDAPAKQMLIGDNVFKEFKECAAVWSLKLTSDASSIVNDN